MSVDDQEPSENKPELTSLFTPVKVLRGEVVETQSIRPLHFGV